MVKKVTWSLIKRDLCLNGVTEVYFWKSNWEKFNPNDCTTPVSTWYLCYRFLYMVAFVIPMIQGFCCRHFKPSFYFIYLTNQTFVVQTIYSILYFFYLAWTFWRKKGARRATRIGPSLPVPGHDGQVELVYKPSVICKILWVFICLLQVAPYFVSVGFWFIVAKEVAFDGLCENFQNIMVHGANSAGALLDAFIISVPIRPLHCIFPFIYALYYGVFTGLYEVLNGHYDTFHGEVKEYIYKMLNWKKEPGKAAICAVGALFGAIIGFLVFGYGIFLLRDFLRRKYIHGEDEPHEHDEHNQEHSSDHQDSDDRAQTKSDSDQERRAKAKSRVTTITTSDIENLTANH